MDGAELKLHSPESAGPVLTLDMPWEGVTCDYHTVFQDGGLYRMYYRGSSHEGYTLDELLEPGEEAVPVHHENVCYAESRDGITWTRPSLGLFEFEGSKVNNIVWLDEEGDTSDLVPFLDGNPDATDDERYKGIVWRGSRVFAVASHDAVTWRFMQDEPILTERPFDSQNVPFWDPWKGEYAIFTRGKIGSGGSFGGGYRWIRRATSPDFLNWSPLELIDTGDTPIEHLYTNGTTPYSRAPGVYLAFPRRFTPERMPREDSPWPGTADSVFMSSRDGLHWDRRFMESIVRPGIGPRHWTSRNNLLSNGIIETGDREISMYVLRHRDYPSVHLERVTWRKDGFVSAGAGYGGGELTTRPLRVRRSEARDQLLHVRRRLDQGRAAGRERESAGGLRPRRLPGDVRRRDRRRCALGGRLRLVRAIGTARAAALPAQGRRRILVPLPGVVHGRYLP